MGLVCPGERAKKIVRLETGGSEETTQRGKIDALFFLQLMLLRLHLLSSDMSNRRLLVKSTQISQDKKRVPVASLVHNLTPIRHALCPWYYYIGRSLNALTG